MHFSPRLTRSLQMPLATKDDDVFEDEMEADTVIDEEVGGGAHATV